MNIKSTLLAATAAISFGSLGLVPAALAGEGGAAGSASFQLDGAGNVENAAVAAAVGKSTAYAGATNDVGFGILEAFAVGTGGRMNFTGASVYINSVTADPDLGTEQINELDKDVEIDATDGEVEVN